VAHRDRAAVDVDVVAGDVQIAHGLDGHRRERLVPCDIAEKASCSSREICFVFVYESVAAPIPSWSNAQNSPSCIMESTSSPLPSR
jgi:hypothetical protein